MIKNYDSPISNNLIKTRSIFFIFEVSFNCNFDSNQKSKMKLVLAILITCFVCDLNALNSEPDLMSLITELVKNNKLDDLVTENPSLNSKDLSHFGLYYKSDLPERSVSHKIENQVHYMDPNLMTQLYQDNWNYDSNNINSNQVNLGL